jgi:hypothetical protein
VHMCMKMVHSTLLATSRSNVPSIASMTKATRQPLAAAERQSGIPTVIDS